MSVSPPPKRDSIMNLFVGCFSILQNFRHKGYHVLAGRAQTARGDLRDP